MVAWKMGMALADGVVDVMKLAERGKRRPCTYNTV